MKGFSSTQVSIETFVQNVESALSGRDLGEIVSFALAGDELLVKFSKLGQSELRYNIERLQVGFQAKLAKEKIALMHKPLKSDITARLARVMEKQGAQCIL
jgi:hypothetical protein